MYAFANYCKQMQKIIERKTVFFVLLISLSVLCLKLQFILEIEVRCVGATIATNGQGIAEGGDF